MINNQYQIKKTNNSNKQLKVTMSKYNVYANSECVWEGDDYDVAFREYTDCIKEDADGVIDLYEIDSYGNMVCLQGIN